LWWQRLRLRRLRGLRGLLPVMGILPPVLGRGACLPTRLTEIIEMAGSDEVDPAVACLLSARIIRAPTGAAMMVWQVSNPFKKC
jgi:hypothetical protein